MTAKNILSNEKFQEIYKDEKFLRDVAEAVETKNVYVDFKPFKTISHPIEYICTEEQKNEAIKEKERLKAEKIANYGKGTLVFIGMGCTFDKRFKGDIGNHRVRSYFKNTAGRFFLVEFSSNIDGEGFHCTESDDLDRERMESEGIIVESPVHSSKQIERQIFSQRYSEKNLLNIVNRSFDANYTRLVVENYILWVDDYISEC